ncbi:MAG TPA: hypothetical protein VF117_07830, partial [Gammaproteobacteria bacterium]
MIIDSALVYAPDNPPQVNTLEKALIVGYGQMGHAMQYLLQERASVEVWAVTPRQTGLPDNIRNNL